MRPTALAAATSLVLAALIVAGPACGPRAVVLHPPDAAPACGDATATVTATAADALEAEGGDDGTSDGALWCHPATAPGGPDGGALACFSGPGARAACDAEAAATGAAACVPL